MARTISEIKQNMTAQFMTDETIRSRYGFADGDTFDDKFSKVSLENVIFFVVAASIYMLESLFDQFEARVDKKITEAVVASIPWYHKISLEFQYGDELVLNEQTQEYGYAVVDEKKRVVKYAAVRDNASGVNVLVSGDESGRPVALEDNVLSAFKQYLNRRKPAGVLMSVKSYSPDLLQADIRVQYDPLVMNPDGTLILEPNRHPVEEAVDGYLNGIVYGGSFNKTRMTDAIQGASGVIDVVVDSVRTKPATRSEYITLANNSVMAVAGSFVSDSLNKTISYVQTL